MTHVATLPPGRAPRAAVSLDDWTKRALMAVNMDDAGDIAPAAAMGMMIFYINAGVKVVHALLSGLLLARTQVWRLR